MVSRFLDEPLKMPHYEGVSEPRVTLDWVRDLAADGLDADGLPADGLPAGELRAVALRVCGDVVEANKLVHAIVPKSSLNRRGKLTLTQGEQTQRLGRLFDMARLAFQDTGDAREFMRRPHPELGGRRPIDAAMTEMGGRAVEHVLDCLLYGLPA